MLIGILTMRLGWQVVTRQCVTWLRTVLIECVTALSVLLLSVGSGGLSICCVLVPSSLSSVKEIGVPGLLLVCLAVLVLVDDVDGDGGGL